MIGEIATKYIYVPMAIVALSRLLVAFESLLFNVKSRFLSILLGTSGLTFELFVSY